LPRLRATQQSHLAEVAILAGRLAADDLGNAISGRAYYSLALDTAWEAADDQLSAIPTDTPPNSPLPKA
jgi:hypothetical protein